MEYGDGRFLFGGLLQKLIIWWAFTDFLIRSNCSFHLILLG